MARKKTDEPQAESSPHPWEAAGFVPLTVKFTPDLHQRAKVYVAGFRGRLLSAFVTLAVEHALDLIDAGRPPAELVKKLKAAESTAKRKPAGAAK